MKIFLLTLFMSISILHIGSIKKANKNLQHLTKPLLMPLLLLIYISNVQTPNWCIVLALICAFFGDVFLMGQEKFFKAGVFSFLAGHIFYTIAFIRQCVFSEIPFEFYIFIVPYAFYGMLVYKRLLPYLKLMKIEAFLYMVTILTMSFASLIHVKSSNGYHFWMPFVGAFLFVISDTMIAFNEFKEEGRGSEEYIMITYIAAQFLIVLGFV